MQSHLTLRRVVGTLGVALPVVLAAGTLLRGEGVARSISGFYATSMRDVFVGTLVAIGLFLLTYKGHDPYDDILGDIACVGALGTAFFSNKSCAPWVTWVHYGSAIVLLGCLALFSLVIFPKGEEEHGFPASARDTRRLTYKACGWVMVGSIVVVIVYFLLRKKLGIDHQRPVFWLETVALWAFGLSWLTKGDWLRQRTPSA